MARARLLDYMQSYSFWLLDVSFPTPVLLPAFGFSAASAPELTLATQEIREGNWHFPRNVVTGAKVGNITLARGVQFFDTDFWRWVVSAVSGDRAQLSATPLTPAASAASGDSVRKRLLLVHFTSYSPGGHNPVGAQLTRVPGKAWVLHECLPVRYRPASDFDATSSAVSLQELELAPEWFEEFSVGV